jgi:cell division protein FtsB
MEYRLNLVSVPGAGAVSGASEVTGWRRIRVLRSQLEQYILEQLGSNHLWSRKTQTELRKVNKEIADLKKKLAVLQARKADLEGAIKK